MIHRPVPQGDIEWLELRMGKFTSSNFDKLMTPKKRQPSASAIPYIHKLLAEEITGQPADSYQANKSLDMTRGNIIEPEARDYFRLLHPEFNSEPPGLCIMDEEPFAGKVACSPDDLQFDLWEGRPVGAEIKGPSAGIHLGYLLEVEENKPPADYVTQVQGSMWVCDAPFWYFVSYHPYLPGVCVKVERDEEFIADLDRCVRRAIVQKDELRETFRAMEAA